jgi:hypothetical protein
MNEWVDKADWDSQRCQRKEKIYKVCQFMMEKLRSESYKNVIIDIYEPVIFFQS